DRADLLDQRLQRVAKFEIRFEIQLLHKMGALCRGDQTQHGTQIVHLQFRQLEVGWQVRPAELRIAAEHRLVERTNGRVRDALRAAPDQRIDAQVGYRSERVKVGDSLRTARNRNRA